MYPVLRQVYSAHSSNMYPDFIKSENTWLNEISHYSSIEPELNKINTSTSPSTIWTDKLWSGTDSIVIIFRKNELYPLNKGYIGISESGGTADGYSDLTFSVRWDNMKVYKNASSYGNTYIDGTVNDVYIYWDGDNDMFYVGSSDKTSFKSYTSIWGLTNFTVKISTNTYINGTYNLDNLEIYDCPGNLTFNEVTDFVVNH